MNLRNNSEDFQLQVISKENPNLSSLLAVYPEDQLNKIIANKDKLAKVLKSFEKSGISSCVSVSILKCGTNCPYTSVCVLRENSMDPTGSPCPIERKIVMELENDVVTFLKIDRSDPIEMEMLWDLIDAKLLDMRTSGSLNDGLVVQTVESRVRDIVNTKREIEPAFEAKMQLKQLKHSIIDSFIATRRSKKKYGVGDNTKSLESMLMEAAKKAQVEDGPTS